MINQTIVLIDEDDFDRALNAYVQALPDGQEDEGNE